MRKFLRDVGRQGLTCLGLCLTVWASAAQSQSSQAIIRYEAVHNPVVGAYGMVASQNNFASQVGRDILQRGGNAVDAAVAMGFALAVTLPRAGNIGGGGFMLVHLAEQGRTIALDDLSIMEMHQNHCLTQFGHAESEYHSGFSIKSIVSV